jgi:hypothetical protein
MNPLVAVLAAVSAVLPHQHRHHHHPRRLRWNGPVTASWYDDAGETACGFHARYGFASLFLPCGARIRMRGPAGTVIAVNQDRGPYVPGRTFDLNPGLKRALGCSDLCAVTWIRWRLWIRWPPAARAHGRRWRERC